MKLDDGTVLKVDVVPGGFTLTVVYPDGDLFVLPLTFQEMTRFSWEVFQKRGETLPIDPG